MWGGIALVSLSVFQYVSNTRLTRQEYLAEKIQSLRLKRKKEIILLESRDVGLVLSPIWFGKADASLNITTIISTNCGHCRTLVAKILKLLDKGFEFRWNIIFGKTSNTVSSQIDFWVQRYFADKEKFLDDLRLWSNESAMDLAIIEKRAFKNYCFSDVIQTFDRHIAELMIASFPKIVINNRILSSIYTHEDIEFMLFDMICA